MDLWRIFFKWRSPCIFLPDAQNSAVMSETGAAPLACMVKHNGKNMFSTQQLLTLPVLDDLPLHLLYEKINSQMYRSFLLLLISFNFLMLLSNLMVTDTGVVTHLYHCIAVMINRWIHVRHSEWHLIFSKCNTIVLPSSLLSFRVQELGNKLDFTPRKLRRERKSQKERQLLTDINKKKTIKY